MIRPRTLPARPRPGFEDEDLLDQAMEMEMGMGGTPIPETPNGLPSIDLPGPLPNGGDDPTRPNPLDVIGGRPNGSVVTTGPNSIMPIGSGPVGGAAGGGTRGTPSPGFTGNRDVFTGFNFDREQNQDNSAKDTFLSGASAGADDLRWQRRETAGAWFDQFVRPGLVARGFEVGEVNGDKAFVHTRENPEGRWIDWVVNIDGDPANGETPQLAWQDQGAGGDDFGAAPPTDPGGIGMQTGGPGGAEIPIEPGGGGGDKTNIGPIGGDSANMEQIMEMIRRLMDPSQRDALLGGAIEEQF